MTMMTLIPMTTAGEKAERAVGAAAATRAISRLEKQRRASSGEARNHNQMTVMGGRKIAVHSLALSQLTITFSKEHMLKAAIG